MVCEVQTLARCLALRDAWQERYVSRPSAAVFAADETAPDEVHGGPRGVPPDAGGGPQEPLFRPQLVEPPPECHAVYQMQEGVYQVGGVS